MDCKNSLHTFVHRTLIYRLIAVGFSLSLLVGLTALFIERGRVSHEAIDFAVGRLSVFSNRYDHLLADPNNLEPEKIQQAFKEAMKIMEEENGSHFDPHLFDIFSHIAKPLYEKFGGKEEIFREELHEIITKYFHEGMDCLEY